MGGGVFAHLHVFFYCLSDLMKVKIRMGVLNQLKTFCNYGTDTLSLLWKTNK